MNAPIPEFLNTPDKVIIWTWEEVYTFLGTLLFSWLMGSFLWGVFLGALMVMVIRDLKTSEMGDLTKVGLYWFIPSYKRFKHLPSSYIREILG